jgi:hypothetical protein
MSRVSINGYTFAFPRRDASGFCYQLPLSETRGRREYRARNAPAALRAKIKKHTSVVTTVTPATPGIPRAMVLRFPSCSPRRAALFCHRRQRFVSANLTPA